LPVKVDVIIRI